MVIPSDENEKAIRSNETLKLIENFVEKAEKVLQVEVSEVTSLQNKVDSFSVGEDEEVSPESRERHVNYATYKSSQMIREHLKLHKSPERNVTLVPRLSWAHLQPWVVPAIPVVVLLALVLGLVAWRCSCCSRGSGDLQTIAMEAAAAGPGSSSTPVSQVIARDLGCSGSEEMARLTAHSTSASK